MLMRNFIVVLFCFVWSNSMAFSSIVIYLLINCLLLCDVTSTYVVSVSNVIKVFPEKSYEAAAFPSLF